jgi:hypothetical protein
MYPTGHARSPIDPRPLLNHKFRELAALGVDDVDALSERFSKLALRTPDQVRGLYDFPILGAGRG